MARTKITLTEKIDAVFSMFEALERNPVTYHLGISRNPGGWKAALLRPEPPDVGGAGSDQEEFASRTGTSVEAALAGLTDEMGKKVEEHRISMTYHLDTALEKSGRALKAAKTLLSSGIDEEEADSGQ